MASVFVNATIVLAAIAAVIFLGLLITFLASYRKVRAPFTAGLVMVAVAIPARRSGL